MTRALALLAAGLSALAFGSMAMAADANAAKPSAEKFTLRYQFKQGETVRWQVVHKAKIQTTVSGTSQTAETLSSSVKVWRVVKAEPNGAATFEHLVESVDMRQKLTGRQEIHYNSQTDKRPPPGFENVAESVGKPLSVVTIDATGQVVRRDRKPAKAAAESEGQITIPMPGKPVAVGETWSFPHDIDVPLEKGGSRRIKAMQQFTLEAVKTGVATIRVETQILTPVSDPAIQAQLIQRESSGTVRFDVDAGRILSQQLDLDKQVVGFRGAASSLHYTTRFTEDLLDKAAQTAAKPKSASAETKK